MEAEMDMGGEAHDHAGHDHSAHASSTGAMDHDKYHGSVQRNPDGSYFYTHGAFLGHVVPGTAFIIWGVWWTLMTYYYYLRACAQRRQFVGRAWWRLPFGPASLRKLPLEPLVVATLPLFGVLGELWLGHESYRYLFEANGMFMVDNLNDWQHSTMYFAFITYGAVSLACHYLGGPPFVEKAYLFLAFLAQFILLVFHLKGPEIEILVHLILSLQVAATALGLLGEMAAPHNIVVASIRPAATVLQGVWWIQTAYIMYRGVPAWDPDYMGSTMMVPVVFVLHMIWIAGASLLFLLAMRAVMARYEGRPISLAPLPSENGRIGARHDSGVDPEVEMSSLIGNKSYLA